MLIISIDTDDISLEESRAALISAYGLERELHRAPFTDGNMEVVLLTPNNTNVMRYEVAPVIQSSSWQSLVFSFTQQGCYLEKDHFYEGLTKPEPIELTKNDLTMDFQGQCKLISDYLKELAKQAPTNRQTSQPAQGSLGYG